MTTLQRNEIFDEATTKKIATKLQPTLTDLLALGLITKQAHWNVIGPNFRPIHLHLDEIWETIQLGADTVAERLSTLAVSPSGQIGEISAESSVSPIPLGFLTGDQVVDLMTDRIGHVCRGIRERMAKIEDLDTVTADQLHAILDGLEKHLWMLRVQGM